MVIVLIMRILTELKDTIIDCYACCIQCCKKKTAKVSPGLELEGNEIQEEIMNQSIRSRKKEI